VVATSALSTSTVTAARNSNNDALKTTITISSGVMCECTPPVAARLTPLTTSPPKTTGRKR
jgi:hypothetical protein